MGYQISYETTIKHRDRHTGRDKRLVGMTAAFLAVFLLLVNFCWPKGREVLRQILWPADTAMVEHFVDELRYGVPLGDAVEGFCREVIQNGDLG